MRWRNVKFQHAMGLAGMAMLAACGTPQEQCIRMNAHDLWTVNRLVAETEANLARGYAYVSVEETHPAWVICDYYPAPPPGPGGKPRPPLPRYCFDDVTQTVQKPVAIDVAAEKRKLADLKRKQAELSRAAAPVVAACQAKYPE